ncbi:hypothetical protein FOZ63_022979, partial [Perkinsus olseni]
KVMELYQTEVVSGPLYRPQARGLVERTIGTVKRRLAATVNGSEDWDTCIDCVLAGMRAAKSESLGMSPFEYLTGRSMRLPSMVGVAEVKPIQDDARASDINRAERIRQVLNVLNTRSTLVPQFKPGDLVLFSKGLKPRRKSAVAGLFIGPLEIVKSLSP